VWEAGSNLTTRFRKAVEKITPIMMNSSRYGLHDKPDAGLLFHDVPDLSAFIFSHCSGV
jgi:hypothetical protein